MEERIYSTSGMARHAGCSEATVLRADRARIIQARRNTSGARLWSHADAEKLRQHIEQRRTAAA